MNEKKTVESPALQLNLELEKRTNGTPNTSPLSLPIANDKTNKNKSDEIKGEKIVCIQTFKNLRTSF